MISIDEAIKFCNEKSKNIKLKADPEVFIDITDMLEEFKRLKQEKEQDIYERAYAEGRDKGYSCGEFNGYNKSIDDFYDKVLNFEDYIEPIDTSEFGTVLLYSGADITRTIYEIAQQLKEGAVDGNSTTDN